jgi:AraC-like DNA-binding protein
MAAATDIQYALTVVVCFRSSHTSVAKNVCVEKVPSTSGDLFARGFLLQDFFENEAMLIDCTPEPEFLSGTFHNDLIQIPNIADAHLSASQVARDLGSELGDPTADGLVGHVDSTLEQHLLNFTQAQVEPEVKPDGVSDDLRRKTVTLEADILCLHRRKLRVTRQPSNCVYVDVTTPEQHTELKVQKPRGLASSKMAPDIADVLLRLLKALHDPIASAVIGAGILRELQFRLLLGPQGGAMIAALKQEGSSGKIIKSLAWMRENMGLEVTIAGLARDVGMSIPSYHVHFRDLTGTSPMQYLKAMRLHEARLLVARSDKTIAEVAVLVGYVSPAQFSRDFKRHFGRTASEESKWIRQHLGELAA